MFLYRLAQWIAGVTAVPVLPVLWVFNAWNLRKSLKYRLGFLPEIPPAKDDGPRFWFHAASVGEVSVVAPLISDVRKGYPSAYILLTTITDAGLEIARKLGVEADLLGYFPLELPGCAPRAVKRFRPHVCVLAETEIWPDFLHAAANAGSRIILVNGRLSSGSLKKYQLFFPIFRQAVNQIHVLSMRTEMDARKMGSLGIDSNRMVVTGNLKHEHMLNRLDPATAQYYRQRLGWGQDLEILVAGSTQEGEEKVVLRAFQRMKRERPGLSLVIAPRHIRRAKRVCELIRREGMEVSPLSSLNGQYFCDPHSVLLVDTIGDLFGLYSIATLVFCGGSLVKKGGQNIFEPAAWGRVVLHGPYMENFLEEKEALEKVGASFTVHTEDQFVRMGLELLRDPVRLERLGREAARVVTNSVGARQRNFSLIKSLLDASRVATSKSRDR